jgi:dipeptidyl aminopeptidase/acylaminoacyl peptidase
MDNILETTQSIPVFRFIEVKSARAPAYSVDGQSLFFLTDTTGIPQIWKLTPEAPWPKQLTFLADRVMSYSVSPAGNLICMNADVKGTENAQLILSDDEGLSVQDLSNDPAHIYQFGRWSADGRRFSYSSNRRNGTNFDVYLYDLDTHTGQLVHSSDYTNHAHGFTPDGKFLLVSRSYTNLNNDLLLVNIHTGESQLLTPHEGEAHYGEDSEYTRVAALDMQSRGLSFLTEDDWDAETLKLAPNGSLLAYSKNENGTSVQYTMDLSRDPRDPASIQSINTLPAGVIDGICWSGDSQQLAIAVNSPSTGADVWAVNVQTLTARRRTFAAISGLPADALHTPELIHYQSFDGLYIPAYYYRPQNKDGPHSVIVYVHGGPESQSRNEFNPILQYFVRHGYAVLVPNVRGSSGYGRTYIHLDDVRKRMDSVADLAKAVDWLVAHGDADPGRIAVMGRSYGGFMVLAAVTHYPQLFAAGIDIVGIANFRSFMENTSPYRRHLREAEYGTIEEDGEFFDEIAPIHRVHDITCPMFVTHGVNDPRVPIAEAEAIVSALESRNHPVVYVRLEDEGHGLVKLKNRIKVFSEIAQFLSEHLGFSQLDDEKHYPN